MPGPWGRAIEALRIAKRLTREVVAKRAKMTPTTYGRIERGQHTQTRKLQDIAEVFGVSIDRVLQNPSLQSGEAMEENADSLTKAAGHAPRAATLPAKPDGSIDVEALTNDIEDRLRARGLVGRVKRTAKAARRK